MVTRGSPKPLLRVRVLLPLPPNFVQSAAIGLHIFGSLPKVGIRVVREQKPYSEGVEASSPESVPLQCLDCVVATLGTAARPMKPVDDDPGVGQEGSGYVSKAEVHVHDGVLCFVPVGEG